MGIFFLEDYKNWEEIFKKWRKSHAIGREVTTNQKHRETFIKLRNKYIQVIQLQGLYKYYHVVMYPQKYCVC